MDSNFIQQLVVIITGAFAATIFAFSQHRRQKVYENINKRYLENGLEDLISYLDNMRTVVEHNYARVIIILRNFRDMNYLDFLKSMSMEKFENTLSPKMPKSYFICSRLFIDEALRKACMGIFINAYSASDYFISDIPFLLSNLNTSDAQLKEKGKEVSEKLLETVNKKYREMNESGMYDVIEILERILLRVRMLDLDSYELLEEVRNDSKIKSYLKEFKL